MFDETPDVSARTSGIDLEMDPQVKLENYEWSELEDQFAKRMEAFRAEEDGIWDEWKAWGEIFKAWASTISVHDEERAAKRCVLLPFLHLGMYCRKRKSLICSTGCVHAWHSLKDRRRVSKPRGSIVSAFQYSDVVGGS